jgi:tyrosyl-tRNA synthetase
MSKSDPNSAIFMEDSAKDVEKKIKMAFCPEKIVEKNPILDYNKSIIFPAVNKLEICRKEEFGGNVTYTSYEELERDFANGELHPGDLKKATANAINELIEPVRRHFEEDPEAR